MARPKVVILGGGPAGVGAAYQLHRRQRGTALLVEAKDHFGGNAGSFFSEGQWLDYGSHRLHAATDPSIMADIKRLLGPDLADRPRNGRIRLRGRWLKFPLKATDLVLRLDPAFAAGATRDMALRTMPGKNGAAGDTFASVLRSKLGPTICEHFYFPYARKIWGHDPDVLSGVQAEKRVSSNSFTKLIRKVLSPPGSGRFYYPREGFGQISRAYADAAIDLGADLRLGTKVVGLEAMGQKGGTTGWKVDLQTKERLVTVEADYVWSTLPIPVAASMMHPGPPAAIQASSDHVGYRAMLLVYLHVDIDRFHETDAHYFPEADLTMTRMSEPKNYFGSFQPEGRTTLCAEVPCQVGDTLWNMDDEGLGKVIEADLVKADLPLPRAPRQVQVARLPHAYPVYLAGYEQYLEPLDAWISAKPRFLTYGRQGLFQHDNTHHALAMAYGAVDCLEGGEFDADKWAAYREVFKTHVVED